MKIKIELLIFIRLIFYLYEQIASDCDYTIQ